MNKFKSPHNDPDKLPEHLKKYTDWKERPCIKCQKKFMSRGSFHRICPKCERMEKSEEWYRINKALLAKKRRQKK
jgi:hypothetical protein